MQTVLYTSADGCRGALGVHGRIAGAQRETGGVGGLARACATDDEGDVRHCYTHRLLQGQQGARRVTCGAAPM